MDTSPCGHFGPLYSVLCTYNLQPTTLGSRDMSLCLMLTALGLKIQVVEFLGGKYKIRLVTSDNE